MPLFTTRQTASSSLQRKTKWRQAAALQRTETDVPDNLGYLMAAYSLMWVIFLLYAWSIASRQGQLKRDLEDLKSRLGRKSGAE
jgi:CcmD family protein